MMESRKRKSSTATPAGETGSATKKLKLLVSRALSLVTAVQFGWWPTRSRFEEQGGGVELVIVLQQKWWTNLKRWRLLATRANMSGRHRPSTRRHNLKLTTASATCTYLIFEYSADLDVSLPRTHTLRRNKMDRQPYRLWARRLSMPSKTLVTSSPSSHLSYACHCRRLTCDAAAAPSQMRSSNSRHVTNCLTTTNKFGCRSPWRRLSTG